MSLDITVSNKDSKEFKADKKADKTKKKRKPTGIAWFDEPYSTVKGETAVWTAVITQAMMDALSKASSAEAKYQKSEAIHWITSNNKDFIEVCLLAGFDPDYVRRKAKKSLLNPVAWRAAPGKGKRYHERRERDQARKEKLSSLNKETKQTPAEHSNKVLIGPWRNSAPSQ